MYKNKINWWKVRIGDDEVNKISQAVAHKRITQGLVTERLEKRLSKLLDVPYALLTINGSTALLMSLLACGLKRGDEVIIPNLTFIATAQAPLLLGASLKIVDVEPKRGLVDVSKIKKAITPKTRVIIPVHLNGRGADVSIINSLASKYKITVIEDAAQALYSRNKSGFLGTQSDFGIFSLALTKLVTTVQGGLIVTRKKKLFEKLKALRSYGVSRRGFLAYSNTVGFNFKFNDILAAFGLSQIDSIEKRAKVSRMNYKLYEDGLKGLKCIRIIPNDLESGEFPLWIEALCSKRDKVLSLLGEKGIQAKPFDPVISDIIKYSTRVRFIHSNNYAREGVILPCGPAQRKNSLLYVIRALRSIDDIIYQKS